MSERLIPLVYNSETNQHEPLAGGVVFDVDHIPLSDDWRNLLKKDQDGLILDARDLVSQREHNHINAADGKLYVSTEGMADPNDKVLKAGDNNTLATELGFRFDGGMNKLWLTGKNGADVAGITLPHEVVTQFTGGNGITISGALISVSADKDTLYFYNGKLAVKISGLVKSDDKILRVFDDKIYSDIGLRFNQVNSAVELLGAGGQILGAAQLPSDDAVWAAINDLVVVTGSLDARLVSMADQIGVLRSDVGNLPALMDEKIDALDSELTTNIKGVRDRVNDALKKIIETNGRIDDLVVVVDGVDDRVDAANFAIDALDSRVDSAFVRLDSVDSAVDAVDERVDGVVARLDDVDGAAFRILGAADAAESNAQNALSASTAAQTSAENALAASSAAQTSAENALSASTAAQTSAENALAASSAAQTSAENALSASTAAQTSAEQAADILNTANTRFVSKIGGETISGVKTFYDAPIILGVQPNIKLKNSNMKLGVTPASTITSYVNFLDKDSTVLNRLATCQYSSGANDTFIQLWDNKASQNNTYRIGVIALADGSAYAYAPTPASSAPDTAVMTKKAVADNYIAKTGTDTTGNNIVDNWIRIKLANNNNHALQFINEGTVYNGAPGSNIEMMRIKAGKSATSANQFFFYTTQLADGSIQAELHSATGSGANGHLGVVADMGNKNHAYCDNITTDYPLNSIPNRKYLHENFAAFGYGSWYVGGANASDTADLYMGRGYERSKPFATFFGLMNFLYRVSYPNLLNITLLGDMSLDNMYPWVIRPNIAQIQIVSDNASAINTLIVNKTFKVFDGQLLFYGVNFNLNSPVDHAFQLNGFYRGRNPELHFNNCTFSGNATTLFKSWHGILSFTNVTNNATGARYQIYNNSVINTGGKGASYVPGSVNGYADTSSQIW